MSIVVVKYGTKWCPACKHSEKPFKELQSKYGSEVTFYSVDIENVSTSLPENIQKRARRVRRMPTFWIYNERKESEIVGWDEEKLAKTIRRFLKKEGESSHKHH